jgi:hypothetical protein
VTLQRIFEGVKRGARGGILLTGVLLSAVAAALAAPRATEPAIGFALPLPTPNRARLRDAAASDRERASEARRHALAFSVRAVGEVLRQIGRAATDGGGNAQAALSDLHARIVRALKEDGAGGLLALRAVQTELFVGACRDWAASGTVSSELRELGGDFPELATTSGWLEGKTLSLTDEDLALLFRGRWNDLSGLSDTPPFAASLDEQRDRYGLLLRHPSGRDAPTRLQRQLGYVTALAALDHDYPAAFARGVLLYRAGAYEAAAVAFRAHLAARPEGPWALRAGNHLLAALARVDEGDVR